MKFKFDDTVIYQTQNNVQDEHNSYIIISKNNGIAKEEMENVIQIIDENGKGVSCTMDKFLEIFDSQGLSGFIL